MRPSKSLLDSFASFGSVLTVQHLSLLFLNSITTATVGCKRINLVIVNINFFSAMTIKLV
uniref:Uncharacterized protein n=1 Tax=Arundo donax TaxID=35708 RepID=A0A0A8Z9Q0_ARUDO